MPQDEISHQLTKAFAMAPMTIAVLLGMDDEQINPRLGDAFSQVLAQPRFQQHFTKGFTLGGVSQDDMRMLVEDGMEGIDTRLELATLAIDRVVETLEQGVYIKVRLFEFAEALALMLESLPAGQEASLSVMARGKLTYLNHKLHLQEDIQKIAG